MSLSFETDEVKARIYRELLISSMRKTGKEDDDALFSRYETYLANFFTKEEMQKKEEDLIKVEDRMGKREANHIFNKCAAEREETAHKPRLTDAEIEELCKPTNKKKEKAEKKKREKAKKED
ncbi:Uncharacterized protein Rs2_30496 [Raphanus sativus]|nr:Uncharacterized protein Rs2_30496 [Raphanus sativus]